MWAVFLCYISPTQPSATGGNVSDRVISSTSGARKWVGKGGGMEPLYLQKVYSVWWNHSQFCPEIIHVYVLGIDSAVYLPQLQSTYYFSGSGFWIQRFIHDSSSSPSSSYLPSSSSSSSSSCSPSSLIGPRKIADFFSLDVNPIPPTIGQAFQIDEAFQIGEEVFLIHGDSYSTFRIGSNF